MKLYKSTDKILVKINDLQLSISPLTLAQKQEVMSLFSKFYSDKDVNHLLHATRLCCKYGIKNITGLQNADDSEYILNFDEQGLSDEDIENLMNSEISNQLSAVVTSFVNGIPAKIVDEKGNQLEGVEVIGLGK